MPPYDFENLRALTLLQPWPAMMLHDFGGGFPKKRVENREYPPQRLGLKVGDTIALHGGRGPSGEQAALRLGEELKQICLGIVGMQPVAMPDFTDPSEVLRFVKQGIYAVAIIEEVITGAREDHDDPWYFGPNGWRLGQFTAIDPPIPIGGAQGAWRVPNSPHKKPELHMVLDQVITRVQGAWQGKPVDEVQALIAAVEPSKPTPSKPAPEPEAPDPFPEVTAQSMIDQIMAFRKAGYYKDWWSMPGIELQTRAKLAELNRKELCGLYAETLRGPGPCRKRT